MTIDKLKEQIKFACNLAGIDLKLIRKSKTRNGVLVYAVNGKCAYVGLNDDYHTINRMYGELGYKKPKITRIL